MPRVLLLNGSLRGATGNSAALLDEAALHLGRDAVVDRLVLADFTGATDELVERVRAADVLIVASGVYWGGWGSPLQRFLEVMTTYELTDVFMGKPAGVLLSMDSVGGSDAGQRLLGVLANLGCLIPPASMVVVSRLAVLVEGMPGNDDVWQRSDVAVLARNVMAAAAIPRALWAAWPVEFTTPVEGPYPSSGPVDMGVPRFFVDAGEDGGSSSKPAAGKRKRPGTRGRRASL